MNILIGGAWIYANGAMHIGHIAGLIAGDVLARYHRQKGDSVCYVSGSDCYGTPISIRAQKENLSPRRLSDYYHEEFVDCFQRLGFSYDMYGKTTSDCHERFVKEFHEKLYKSASVIEKTINQAYCESCARFLPDRFINGNCPECGAYSRGDQCDSCGFIIEGVQLINPSCAECGRTVSLRPSKHLFLRLSDFSDQIAGNINERTWRSNAVDFTLRYISEGLHERALTRDLDWGIDVPGIESEEYAGKKIYIWAENVLGYLSMCREYCKRSGEDFNDYYKSNNAFHYYVHGKDNIPFHSIILPALLLAHGEGLHLPDAIISSEFVTLDGKRISTSANHAIWIKDLLESYNPDAIRYFFLANSPEKRDADFTIREFINNNNGELLGVYGNFVNRTLVFIEKYFEMKVPEGKLDPEYEAGILALYDKTGDGIEHGRFKDSIADIFTFLRRANKYFDIEQPWLTRVSEPEKCANTIYNCVQIIANTAVLLEPFIPFSSRKIYSWLCLENNRSLKTVPAGSKLLKSEILFERIQS